MTIIFIYWMNPFKKNSFVQKCAKYCPIHVGSQWSKAYVKRWGDFMLRCLWYEALWLRPACEFSVLHADLWVREAHGSCGDGRLHFVFGIFAVNGAPTVWRVQTGREADVTRGSRIRFFDTILDLLEMHHMLNNLEWRWCCINNTYFWFSFSCSSALLLLICSALAPLSFRSLWVLFTRSGDGWGECQETQRDAWPQPSLSRAVPCSTRAAPGLPPLPGWWEPATPLHGLE